MGHYRTSLQDSQPKRQFEEGEKVRRGEKKKKKEQRNGPAHTERGQDPERKSSGAEASQDVPTGQTLTSPPGRDVLTPVLRSSWLSLWRISFGLRPAAATLQVGVNKTSLISNAILDLALCAYIGHTSKAHI